MTGAAELDALVDTLYEMASKVKNASELKALDLEKEAKRLEKRQITPDIALSGRMSTSSMFEEVEASLQVAHAISTHRRSR